MSLCWKKSCLLESSVLPGPKSLVVHTSVSKKMVVMSSAWSASIARSKGLRFLALIIVDGMLFHGACSHVISHRSMLGRRSERLRARPPRFWRNFPRRQRPLTQNIYQWDTTVTASSMGNARISLRRGTNRGFGSSLNPLFGKSASCASKTPSMYSYIHTTNVWLIDWLIFQCQISKECRMSPKNLTYFVRDESCLGWFYRGLKKRRKTIRKKVTVTQLHYDFMTSDKL